jgi:hypothetical protein
VSDLPFRPGPDPTRNLPVLRITGVPDGAPEWRALAHRFDAALKQFYNAQAQNAELSGLPQYAKRVDRGDHQLQYVRQAGQETVTLTVHPTATAETSEKPVVEKPWDWAVVEFETDVETYQNRNVGANPTLTETIGQLRKTQWSINAVRSSPEERTTAWPHEGTTAYPVYDHYPENAHSKLSWADVLFDSVDGSFTPPFYPHPIEHQRWEEEEPEIGRHALLIDLREYHTYDFIKFEIYAQYGYRFPDLMWTTLPTALGRVWPSWPGGPITVYVLGSPVEIEVPAGVLLVSDSNYAQHDAETNFPEYAGGTVIGVSDLGNLDGYSVEITMNNYFQDDLDTNIPHTLRAKGAMFRGTPPWGSVVTTLKEIVDGDGAFTQEVQSFRWEIEGKPQFGTGSIGRPATIEYDPAAIPDEQRVSLNSRKFVGDLIISPKHGWLSFKPVDA